LRFDSSTAVRHLIGEDRNEQRTWMGGGQTQAQCEFTPIVPITARYLRIPGHRRLALSVRFLTLDRFGSWHRQGRRAVIRWVRDRAWVSARGRGAEGKAQEQVQQEGRRRGSWRTKDSVGKKKVQTGAGQTVREVGRGRRVPIPGMVPCHIPCRF
jgi:hypothetical protein